MTAADPARFDLEQVLVEIAEDEKVDRAAKRILSQADIQRLVDESRRRRREAGRETTSS